MADKRCLRIAQHIDSTALVDYRDASRRLGISAPQLTHYIALLDLAAPIQEDILFGRIDVPERTLRPIVANARWCDQQAE
ncbi:MAG: hypothetical protein ACT4PU_00580 [Planctomycetota bacterium]